MKFRVQCLKSQLLSLFPFRFFFFFCSVSVTNYSFPMHKSHSKTSEEGTQFLLIIMFLITNNESFSFHPQKYFAEKVATLLIWSLKMPWVQISWSLCCFFHVSSSEKFRMKYSDSTHESSIKENFLSKWYPPDSSPHQILQNPPGFSSFSLPVLLANPAKHLNHKTPKLRN